MRSLYDEMKEVIMLLIDDTQKVLPQLIEGACIVFYLKDDDGELTTHITNVTNTLVLDSKEALRLLIKEAEEMIEDGSANKEELLNLKKENN